MAHVEYCLGNVDSESRRRLRARGDGDVGKVREASCLEHCGNCHAGPFLVVDGEVRRGASHVALLAEIDGRPGSASADGRPGGASADGRSGEIDESVRGERE